MNGPHPSELLSAYLDDEVTAEQRARVDEWLASSPEGRRELEDLRRLSTLLTETLPLLEAPVSLLDRVRESVANDSGTPGPTAASNEPHTEPDPSRRTPVPAPSLPRRRSNGVTAALGLCAMLLVVATSALLLGPPPKNGRDLARNGGEYDMASAPMETELDDLGHHAGPRADEPIVTAAVGQPHAVGPSGEMAAIGARRDKAPSLNGARPKEHVESQLRRYYVDGRGLARGDGLVLPTTTPGEIAAGDVLPVVETRGGRVVVVEVTVVDVRRALGEVQLLLRQNAISELRSEKAEGLDGERIDVDRELNGEDEFAVYVSTSPERLSDALAALRDNELVVSVDEFEADFGVAESAKPLRIGREALVANRLSADGEAVAAPPSPAVEKSSEERKTAKRLTDSYQLLGRVRRAEPSADEEAEPSARADASMQGGAVVPADPQERADDRQPARVLLLLRSRGSSDSR